ncbi:hypothetical protein A2634_02540 [Candidatus Amesbacteria bacterium RIFCSPHIGHO2_01_FULL_48_32]|uniref:Uncharacterized protein n=1 Tax=Candidatus Amesbacteria bacterium RIFCSPLOWO2_01_FULL_48_25 TaxID=1797259 RepID=A0A1F4ZE08_9BACT|nr:MAG: hypothetical protein A2634_02540 [Candidatus Amesbacteria bacterium RIFCSPHIGHO2_01_FULL_48_32]OGD04458.1 MAG: hypothetical protein A2989_05535 [Candidatus Amesbacteria bacterium RIFCSPLOWO2_01_FULL_48_25]HJZ06307.1 hypothetical protein [Patescibacteria group bacterium]
MTKKLKMIGVAAALFAASVLPTFAAEPAVQGCFGHDISSYATEGETDPGSFFEFESGAGWGGFISGVATSLGADDHFGVGGEINAHQAGVIPDTVISNSCN